MSDPSNEAASSADLIARAGKGDRDAFETLVYRHQRSILNFIYRFIGDREGAEDLAQEVFLRVWRSAATYKPSAKFTTWIYRITINLCINKQKADRIRKFFMVPLSRKGIEAGNEPLAGDNEKVPSPEDLLLEAEQKRQILDALQKLPANQKTALTLKRYEGLSYQEIARVMDRSVSSVDSLLVRAKRRLSKKLSSLEK